MITIIMIDPRGVWTTMTADDNVDDDDDVYFDRHRNHNTERESSLGSVKGNMLWTLKLFILFEMSGTMSDVGSIEK